MNSALQDLYTDPKLIFDLAAGVESLHSIASRYELDLPLLEELIEKPHIKKVLAERKKELDESGYTLAQKAKLCFEDLLGTVYTKARDKEATLTSVLAAAEFFRKVAGLDKKDIDVNAAEKFSITINIGAGKATISPTKPVIDVEEAREFNPHFMGLEVIKDDALLTLNSQFDYEEPQ